MEKMYYTWYCSCSVFTMLIVLQIRKRDAVWMEFFSKEKLGWQMFDVGVACQSFCLAAKEQGLGTVIMGIFDEEKISELLEIPPERELAALIAVGWPDDDPQAPKRKAVLIY